MGQTRFNTNVRRNKLFAARHSNHSTFVRGATSQSHTAIPNGWNEKANVGTAAATAAG